MTYGITACWPIFNNGYIKSQRVYEIYWITLNIAIFIQSPHQPNRITLRITSAFRVISTVVIIEQAAFAVVVLAWKAQGVGETAEALRVASGRLTPKGSRLSQRQRSWLSVLIICLGVFRWSLST